MKAYVLVAKKSDFSTMLATRHVFPAREFFCGLLFRSYDDAFLTMPRAEELTGKKLQVQAVEISPILGE